MINRLPAERGFTLLEIIVSLLLISVVDVVMGLSGVQLAKSFIATRTNADTLLKGQIAMARIQKELNNLRTVSSSSIRHIT
nr:prepilin-type N-terminal cleavage/methylation domain-containing protein [Smithellaceae bacterium]